MLCVAWEVNIVLHCFIYATELAMFRRMWITSGEIGLLYPSWWQQWVLALCGRKGFKVTLVVDMMIFSKWRWQPQLNSCDELGAVEEEGLGLQQKCFVMSSVQLTHALKRKVQSQSQLFTPKRCPMSPRPSTFVCYLKEQVFVHSEKVFWTNETAVVFL
jgi:hypothetical protein